MGLCVHMLLREIQIISPAASARTVTDRVSYSSRFIKATLCNFFTFDLGVRRTSPPPQPEHLFLLCVTFLWGASDLQWQLQLSESGPASWRVMLNHRSVEETKALSTFLQTFCKTNFTNTSQTAFPLLCNEHVTETTTTAALHWFVRLVSTARSASPTVWDHGVLLWYLVDHWWSLYRHLLAQDACVNVIFVTYCF